MKRTPEFVDRESDRLTEWAYFARWFVLPISLAGWFLARILAYVFGVSANSAPSGYLHIFLIRNRPLHEYVPPWLGYLYNGMSALVIVSIALVAIHWIVSED